VRYDAGGRTVAAGRGSRRSSRVDRCPCYQAAKPANSVTTKGRRSIDANKALGSLLPCCASLRCALKAAGCRGARKSATKRQGRLWASSSHMWNLAVTKRRDDTKDVSVL